MARTSPRDRVLRLGCTLATCSAAVIGVCNRKSRNGFRPGWGTTSPLSGRDRRPVSTSNACSDLSSAAALLFVPERQNRIDPAGAMLRNQTRSGGDDRQQDEGGGGRPGVARVDAVQLRRDEPSEHHSGGNPR